MTTFTYLVGTAEAYTTLNAAVTAAVSVANINTTNTVDIFLKGPNTGGPSKYSPTKMELTGAGTILRAQINVKAYDLTDKPIIDGVGGGNTCFLLNQNYSGASLSSFTTTFQGLKFQNWTTTGAGANEGLIYVGGNGAVNVSDCEFYNCLNTQIVYGINAASPRTSTIERNKFTDTWPGVQIWGNSSTRVIVKNNVFIVTASAGGEVGGAIAAPIGTSGAGAKGGLVYNNSIYWYVGTGVNAASGDLISALTASNNAAYSVNDSTAVLYKMINAGYASNNCLYESVGTPTYLNVTTDGGGNLTATDPKFSSPSGGDLSITKTSPCYNAGEQISSVTDSYNGVARPTTITATSKYDIGAYEYYDVVVSNASRILNLPEKIMVSERDASTGSYPTIGRTGDPDFNGTYPAFFDDSNTINFIQGNNVLYPVVLPSGSPHLLNDVQAASYFQGITAPGNVTAGTSDTHVHFTPGQNISPFNESRVYLDNDSQFHSIGTSTGTLPGFNQRLSSKTSLVLNLYNSSSHEVYFSTGTATVNRHSGMSLFNFQRSSWETFGDVSSAGSVDFLGGNFQKGYVGFSSRPVINFTTADEVDPKGVGYPITNFGFPYDERYFLTSSLQLSLSNYINSPFLLEKVEIQFSASFPSVSVTTKESPLTSQFFLLRQGTSGSQSQFVLQSQATGRTNGVTSFSTTFVTKSFDRDLISFGMISRYASGTFGGTLYTGSFRSRDLNIIERSGVSLTAVTGSFSLNFPARSPALHDGFTLLLDRNATSTTAIPNYLINNVAGTRNGGLSCGRSFIKTVVGQTISGTLYLSSSNPNYGYVVNSIDSYDSVSPYVLLPNDKISLGFSNIPFFPFVAGGSSAIDESGLSNYRVNFPTSPLKVILYGSLIRNNQYTESETNQPLTSNAIHEDLHFDAPVFDQFDVESADAFQGSYVDNIITGSMFASPIADPTAPNVRAVQTQVTRGQAGTTGSLQRFVRHTDTYGTLYDSYPPNPLEVIKKSGQDGIFDSSGTGKENYLAVGAPAGSYWEGNLNKILSGVDHGWYMRSAYEVNSNRFVYSSFASQKVNSFDYLNNQYSDVPMNHPNTALIFGSGSDFGVYTISTDSNLQSNTEESRKSTIKWLFGFGDSTYNLPNPNILFGFFGIAFSTPIIRGYKYGLAGLFGSSADVRFRRDRFGQFRDMLEQRRYPATLLPDGSVEYPIEISFVPQDTGVGSTSPLNTHSQNLSTHATSSVPYFDGVARDRDDDPDVTLSVPVNYTIT